MSRNGNIGLKRRCINTSGIQENVIQQFVNGFHCFNVKTRLSSIESQPKKVVVVVVVVALVGLVVVVVVVGLVRLVVVAVVGLVIIVGPNFTVWSKLGR